MDTAGAKIRRAKKGQSGRDGRDDNLHAPSRRRGKNENRGKRRERRTKKICLFGCMCASH
jgi:hypothetical protein